MGTEWLDTGQIAALLGVSRNTIYQWLERELLPYEMVPGDPLASGPRTRGPVRKVKASDLEAFRDRWGFRGGKSPSVRTKRVKVQKPPGRRCPMLLTQLEAARIAGVGQTSITNWVRLGKIQTVPCPCGKCTIKGKPRRYVDREALLKFMERGGPTWPRYGRLKGSKNKPRADA